MNVGDGDAQTIRSGHGIGALALSYPLLLSRDGWR
jgi:hypothetical protein